MSSTIIKRRLPIAEVYSQLKTDLLNIYAWVDDDEATSGDVTELKCYVTNAMYLSMQNTAGNSSAIDISINIDGTNNIADSVFSESYSDYISYTLIKTGNSLAMAFSSSSSVASNLSCVITLANSVPVIVYNGICYYNNEKKSWFDSDSSKTIIPTPIINSSFEWAQLYPLGLPDLGGASNEIYIIRSSPITNAKIAISDSVYQLGDKIAIRLEVNND